MTDEPLITVRPTIGPADVFVGRQDLLRSFADAPADVTRIVDIEGVSGSGRTELLRRAREAAVQTQSRTVFEIAIGDTDAEVTARPLGAFCRYREILSGLLRETLRVSPADGGPSQADARSLKDAISRATNDARVAAVESPGGRENLIEASRAELAEAFSWYLESVAGERPLLATIDNYEQVASLLGPWLVDVVRRLPRTQTLVARTPAIAPIKRPPATETVRQTLPPLGFEDIRKVLVSCLPDVTVTDDLVAVVERASGGHAQTVGLAVLRMQGLGRSLPDLQTIAAHLACLAAEPETVEHAAMIDDRVPDQLRPVIEKCCVLRSFSASLLEAMVEPLSIPRADLIRDLRANLLIKECPDPREGVVFTLETSIRRRFDERFKADDRDGWRAANRRAARLVNDDLQEFAEGRESIERESYGAWYRYEQPDWQAALRDWMYYEARAATDDDRATARARLATHFFDALYWWGCYVPFAFIPQLLDDWDETLDDRAFSGHLRTILEHYPIGYRKDGNPERWDAVQGSLLMVRQLCGQPQLDEDQRHLGGLIQTFLAHTERYSAAEGDEDRRARYDRALEFYTEALDLFRSEEDDWSIAWTLFERAELHVEHGDNRAHDDWRTAAALVGEQDDDELAANLHRVAADFHWPGDARRVFDSHGQAILYAYLFQGRYMFSKPYRPDEYTRAFYLEQIERALERLAEYARADGDIGAAVAALRKPLGVGGLVIPEDELARLCAAGSLDDLRRLFPDPPQPADLGIDDSEFMQQWVRITQRSGAPKPSAEGSRW